MVQPTTFNRVTSFTNYQTSNPASPLLGSNVDAELNAVKLTLDEVLTNLALLQRDDGRLANGTVSLDSLAADILAGINPPTVWATATEYTVSVDSVFINSKIYQCAETHTSGTFATDLTDVKWLLIADFLALTYDNSTSGLAATTPQDAIDEIVAEFLPLAGGTMTGALLAAAGTVALPGVAFSGDADTGIYRIGANNLGVAVGGAKVVDVGAAAVSIAQPLTLAEKLTLSKAVDFADYANVASATTADIGAAAANLVNITGTTTITGLGTADAGVLRLVKFAGALTLTHNATSLILPGAANITTAAGDSALLVSEGSGNWRCLNYTVAAVSQVAASDTVKGPIEIATAAEITTGTDATRAVTPARQQAHESAVKAWCGFNGTGATGVYDSYNISSVTDNSVGNYTFNFTTAFASGDSYVGAGIAINTGNEYVCIQSAPTATGYAIIVIRPGTGAVDVDRINMMWAGTQ